MSKYSNNLDIQSIKQNDPNSTIATVLNSITPHSKILELGCANGYITKYLKEELFCEVSIIEINKQDYQEALQYAVDGFCGDLNTMEWYEYFKTKQFDYIIIMDVLEHLINPLQVLSLLKFLIVQNGKIIFSIPNICHNDIIIQMFYNNFTYTSLGLLDNTHIHFWGLNNIENFVKQAELQIVTIIPIIVPTNRTEQAIALDSIDAELIKILLEKRQYGNVYQFVVICEKG